jgi:hypothetical protein
MRSPGRSAVSAAWEALDPDPLTAACEATYEAYSALDEP